MLDCRSEIGGVVCARLWFVLPWVGVAVESGGVGCVTAQSGWCCRGEWRNWLCSGAMVVVRLRWVEGSVVVALGWKRDRWPWGGGGCGLCNGAVGWCCRERSSGGGVAEKKSSSVAEKGDRVAEKNREMIFKFEIYLKRRRFGSPRTGPDPTRTGPVPKPYRKFFFLAENGYAWGTHAAVPRRYTYPRRTRYGYGAHFAVPVLPSWECSYKLLDFQVLSKIHISNYEGGVTSMEPFLKKFFPKVYTKMNEDTKISNYCKFDSQLLTSFTSSLYIAGLVASLFASSVTRAFGRKPSILVGAAAFLVGSALGGAAMNVSMLIFGRIFLGIGIGFANQSVPLYLSEMAPPNYRGATNIGFELCVGIASILTLVLYSFQDTQQPDPKQQRPRKGQANAALRGTNVSKQN
uniref:Major facilitator superfamily (MFS) profile domain-containing protein n=1 Tax=Fagus sylvatica TaxID=28930 RepID=A0A2N9FXT6_FAGSY